MPPIESLISDAAGSAVLGTSEVGGGFTHTRLIRAGLANGRTVVAKAATDERTADDVRLEHRVLSAYGLDCMPRVEGFTDGDRPVLLLEDLGDAHWPPPWPNPDALIEVVESLGRIDALPDLPPLRNDRLPTWDDIAGRADDVAATGVVSADWLRTAAPVLGRAARDAGVEGDRLVHADIWWANVCYSDRGVVLVDWAGAAAGSTDFDRMITVVDLFATTGTLPEYDWPTRPAMAALMGAMKCNAVTITDAPWATADWHDIQVDDLRYALRWAATEHGLPEPF